MRKREDTPVVVLFVAVFLLGAAIALLSGGGQ